MCRRWCLVLRAAVACFSVLVFAAPSLAQTDATVRGVVVAAADGSSLAGTVSLTRVPLGQSSSAMTDSGGRFVFPPVPPGIYTLSVSSDGFAVREVRLVLEPREIRTVTLSLDLARLDVSLSVTAPPTISGTHSPSSTVLSAERIEELPPLQRGNLPDAIVTAAPGMIRGHDDFVHVRGQEVALNPVINGVSFWENAHSLLSAGLSPDVIDTANVITGGFPAEYGSRFAVVDIVTKSGSQMSNDGSVWLSGGQAGRRHVAGEFGGRRGSFGYYGLAAIVESDRFLSPPHPTAIHDEARGGHAFLQLDRSFEDAGAFRLVLMGDGMNFEIPKTPTDVELRPLANAEQRTRQQTAILGWMRPWTNSTFSASFYQRWSTLDLLPATGPLTAQAELERELLTLGGKADLLRFTGKHVVKAGVDAVRLSPRETLVYNYQGFRDLTHLLELPHMHVAGNAIGFQGRQSGGQVSAYAQDTIQIGERTTADLGVRLDRYDLIVSATHLSPRVNLAFSLPSGSLLHASYNRFFVPPPVEGILSSSAGLTSSIREIDTALPPLRPMVEDQVEAGISTPLRPLSVAATAYYRATDNPIHTTVWPDSRIYSYASFDRARSYGLELSAQAPGLARYGVTAYANYALSRVDFSNPVTGGFVTEAAHLHETNRFLAPMDQTHTLTAGAAYRHAATGVWIGTSMEYGGGTPIGHGESEHHSEEAADHAHGEADVGDRVPGHFVGDISFGVDLFRGDRRGRLSLRVDLENITDNVYVIAQESEFSPAQFAIPRLFSVTARVRF